MADFERTPMWLATLAEQEDDPFPNERETLRNAYRHLRENGGVLAAEVPDAMRDLTVHDLSHIDALWDLASQIAGPGILETLTPTEAFVFGGAAIVHDLGLSAVAYPTGFDEIRNSSAYRVAYGLAERHGEDAPAAALDRQALRQVIRLEHADKATSLASEPWRHPSGEHVFLFEPAALRKGYGWLVGRIGASHGWPQDRLAAEFDQRVNQPSGYPPEWSVDPLKVACLLRLADAAHLDSRRAPDLLRAVRKPEGHSALHWTFQEHLHGVSVTGDRIRFSAGQPFDLEDAPAWWLGYDIVRMVDDEFRGVDSLLADLGRSRFQVNGVLGAESPSRFARSVPTRGWNPVNAQIHVSNVAALVERLGGAHLYGFDNTAGLRELIQNATDAVRLRRMIENRPDEWGSVTVSVLQEDSEVCLEVGDSGVGMTDAVVTDHLLNFGGSLWDAVDVARLIPDFDPNFRATGKFGIGFFSAFMLGKRIRVVTRPRTSAPDGTKVLEIDRLSHRPVLRQARADERLSEPGTRVRIWLDDPAKKGASRGTGLVDVRRWAYSNPTATDVAKLCAFLCPTLDSLLEGEIAGERAVALEANDWIHLSAGELHRRIQAPALGSTNPPDPEEETQKSVALAELNGWLAPIEGPDGNLLGRAAIPAINTPLVSAVIAVGGLRARTVGGLLGVFVGQDPTLARDSASLAATEQDLSRWASDQAKLYAEMERDPLKHSYFAASVLSYGGDPGPLKLCCAEEDAWLDRHQLEERLLSCSSAEILRATMEEPRPRTEDEIKTNRSRADIQVRFISTPSAFAPAWTESHHVGDIPACIHHIVERAWQGAVLVDQNASTVLLTRSQPPT